MRHTTTSGIVLPRSTRSRRSTWLAALLTFVAGAAIVLVLVLGDSSSEELAPVSVLPALRTDGGPEESNTAAAIRSRPSAGPDESRIAALISSR